jgi:hypothetical protein
MPLNSIKSDGDSARLQITTQARAADLVDEMGEGEDRMTTYRADVRVHSFDSVLLVGDTTMDNEAWADIVAKAATYTDSSYQCIEATIQHDGNGYSVALPVATEAGFQVGDDAPVHPAPQLLVIAKDNVVKIGRELASLRKDQVEQ